MPGVNKWIGLGNLTRDPEVISLDSGAKVASFSIACNEAYKDRNTGERKESVEYVNIVLWRGLAEIAERWLKKGSQVYIEGKLTTRSWEKDGEKRYTTEVVGNNLVMLGGNSGSANSNQPPPPGPADAPMSLKDDDEDLPF